MAVSSPWDDDVMATAFWGFVRFASREMIDEFTDECGPINLATDFLGSEIDKATGKGDSEAQRFVDWCVTKFGTPEQVYSGE